MKAFFQRKDVWLILAALFVILLLFAVRGLGRRPAAVAGYVRIYVGQEVYKTVPLGKAQTVTVEQENGRVNQIYIDEDGACMHASTCENQDCVKMGEVTLANREERMLGPWIVCLPNEVSIELVSGQEAGAAE